MTAPPPPSGDPPSGDPPPADPRARFRRNLARVMSVQVVALVLLWLLQQHFTP